MRLKRKAITASLFPVVFIFVVIALVFAVTIGYDFVPTWDDGPYVTYNPYIQGFSWENLNAIFSRFFQGNFAPLHLLSYMVDHALWGLDPRGYHLTNLLLHLFNSLFLFYLIKRITERQEVALLAALLFAVHPVQVENVAWISQRKSLLAMALFLPAFYLYTDYAGTGKRSSYWASVLFYGSSLLAKVSTISLPLLFLLYDACFRERLEKKNFFDKVPFLLAAGGIGVVTVLSQTQERGILYFRGSPFVTLLTTIVIVKKYLWNLIMPVNLSAYYSFIYTRIGEPMVLFSLACLAIVLYGMIYLVRQDKKAGFWALWFWAVILPNLNFIPLTVIMADRYLYIPMIGPAVLASLALFRPWKKRQTNQLREKALRYFLAPGLIVLLLAVISFSRSRIWESDLALWTDTAARTESGIPYNNLGNAYLALGKTQEAKQAYAKSIEVLPYFDQPHRTLGLIYLREKNLPKAEEYFLQALRFKPENPEISRELSMIYADRGELDKALHIIDQGLQLSPERPGLLVVKAQVLSQKGNLGEAVEVSRRLVELFPGTYMHWYNYGALLARRGSLVEAESALKEALKIDAALPNAYVGLASLYETQGDYARTAKYYEESLKRNPGDLLVLNNLSFFYSDHFPEKSERAIALAQKALELAPGNPDIIDTLGWAYFKKGDPVQARDRFEQSLKLRPDDPNFLYHIGLACLEAGDPGCGVKNLQELIKKFPKHPLAEKAGEILDR